MLTSTAHENVALSCRISGATSGGELVSGILLYWDGKFLVSVYGGWELGDKDKAFTDCRRCLSLAVTERSEADSVDGAWLSGIVEP
jgi:hypothetical protein